MTNIEINTDSVVSTNMMNSNTTSKYCDQTTVTTAVSEDFTTSELDASSRSTGSTSKRSRRKRSSRRRRNKRENRDLLMGLIAQEMTSSWNDNDPPPSSYYLPEDEDCATVPSTISAADIFYAQMNGEQLQTDSSMPSVGASLIQNTVHTSSTPGTEIITEEEVDNFPDHTSFACLNLAGDLQDEAATGQAKRAIFTEDISISRRSHNSLGSVSKKSTGSASSSSESRGDDNLSMREIQDIVMAQMPEDVKKQIPKEAWGRIFSTAGVDLIRKPVNSSAPIEEEEEEEKDQAAMIEEMDDDLSVISDITMYTTAVNTKRPPQQVAPMAPAEQAAQDEELARDVFGSLEEDLCPSLPSSSYNDYHGGAAGSIATSRDTASRESEDRSFRQTFNNNKRISMDGSVQNSTASSSRSCVSGVRFGNVQIRYYERIMDVNPSVTNGVAIAIGWRYKRGGTMRVDDWENQRGGHGRCSDELVMPRHVRDAMLKDLGYTQKDFAAATRIILKAKQNRKTTVLNLGSEKMEEAVENATRRVRGLLSFGRSKGIV